MNILFLSESYYPHLSGVPVVVKYLAEGLVRKGHRVTVATSIGAAEDLPESDSLNGVGIRRFHIWRNLAKCLRGEIKALQQYVLNGDFDVVVIECGQAATTDALLPVLENVKARKILHAHGLSGMLGRNKPFSIKSDFKHTIGATYNWARMHWYYDVMFKRACRHFDASISLTDSDSGYPYLSRHVKKKYVLGNAADDMFFEKTTSSLDVVGKYTQLDNTCFMVSCANYSYIKNQFDIITQYYRSETSKNMSLVCIGSSENDYYRDCEALVNRLEQRYGHRDVHLLHGVERSDLPSFIHKASLYLAGSRTEVYSISLIEAMSQGVPFISTDVGNARELPGGIAIGSIEEMHTAIDRLMSDMEEWHKLSEAGRKFAYEECRIELVVDKLEGMIDDTNFQWGGQFLISIANYTVVKDQLNMLRQFYLTSSKHVALVMIGSKENDYYKKVVEEKKLLDERYGKRQVLMLTGVDRKHFPAILEKASLYLTSSTYEEYSISIIEAMSRGVPFISTDVGNARLLPGGVTLDSISDMHTAIDRLLSDENERKRLSVAAKKYAYEHCRIDAVVTQLEKILEEEVV